MQQFYEKFLKQYLIQRLYAVFIEPLLYISMPMDKP